MSKQNGQTLTIRRTYQGDVYLGEVSLLQLCFAIEYCEKFQGRKLTEFKLNKSDYMKIQKELLMDDIDEVKQPLFYGGIPIWMKGYKL